MRTGRSYCSTKGSSSVRMPLCPSSSVFQVVSASVANAVVMAMPVTTTLGKPFPVANFDDVVIDLTNVPFGCRSSRPPSYPASSPDAAASVPAEGQRDVVSAEAERVVDGVLVLAITRLARDNVKVDLGIGCRVVKCRRNDAIAQRQHRQDGLQCADGADGVTQRADFGA